MEYLYHNMIKIIFLFSITAVWQVESYDLYPYNPKIHSIGNHGLQGKLHAELAPIFTKFTDRMVYGEDIRKRVLNMFDKNKSIIDIGCGTGFSTSDSNGSLGIDTSEPMILKARKLFPKKNFEVAHAEQWSSDKRYDIATAMFCFHEIPRTSRINVIENLLKNVKEKIVIVDISPCYNPNEVMLSGEPYIPDYLKNIQEDLREFEEDILFPKHVHMWTLNIN